MFEQLQAVPADPILGLTEAFNQDPNPNKVNLGVGIFKDSEGRTPTLKTVLTAQKRFVDAGAAMTYLPILGAPAYGKLVAELVLGRDSELLKAGRTVTAHTPGGTGALRVAADLLASQGPKPTVWMSTPTWANHGAIFSAAGLATKGYPYFEPKHQGLDIDAMCAALAQTGPSDVVLLHACCHNPTGIDPTLDQWHRLAEVQKERGFVPLFDFAYQGFATDLEADAAGLRALAGAKEMLIASSFSKNFGLYNQRTGALTLVGSNADTTRIAAGHLSRAIRANYSNPPAFGGALVTTVLSDPELRAEWEQEVVAMRSHIHTMREAMVAGLRAAGAGRDFGFLAKQRGMFSFSGLSDEQVDRLRERYGIYVVKGGGRMNVAAVTPDKVTYICNAIAEVLRAAA